MFGIRTPFKKTGSESKQEKSPETTRMDGSSPISTLETAASNVRRSIGEWETVYTDSNPQNQKAATTNIQAGLKPEALKPKSHKISKDEDHRISRDSKLGSPSNSTYTIAKSKQSNTGPTKKEKPRRTSEGNMNILAQETIPPTQAPHASPKTKPTQSARVAEARACLNKAKIHLNSSRNTKTEIKEGVITSLDRLYQLVKEAEEDKTIKYPNIEPITVGGNKSDPPNIPSLVLDHEKIMLKLEEQARLIVRNNAKMEELKERLENHQKAMDVTTYAKVVANGATKTHPQLTALHSVVVTSKDEMETGEEVLEKIKKAVDAKEGGINIDKIRKAKDRKVIVGCRSRDEMEKVKDRIKQKGGQLTVEEIKNKDPLIVLYGVLQSNSDEDVVKAIKKQNEHLIRDVPKEENRIEVRFRRKARNPLTAHIVLRVSPLIWQRLTNAGTLHVDMQRIRVADQSPLIQCSRCLGYGHGRRFCREAADVCSHCGGQHIKSECAEWLSETPPNCTNCIKAKMEKVNHNAFSLECQVRRKWEALARSTVAYC